MRDNLCESMHNIAEICGHVATLNYCRSMAPKSATNRPNENNEVKVVQDHSSHRNWYQSKALMRLPISD